MICIHGYLSLQSRIQDRGMFVDNLYYVRISLVLVLMEHFTKDENGPMAVSRVS